MIRLKLVLLDESIKETDVIKSIFKVYSDEGTTEILSITQDKDTVINLLELTADIEVPNGLTYYVQGSYITETGGLSYPSKLVPIISGDTIDIEIDNYLPQLIKPPVITTPYPRESHSHKGFIASIDNLNITLNKQYATTWILVRLVDDVIVESYIEDTVNIYSKKFVNSLLPGLYELKVRRHMLSNDDSIFGVFNFVVRDPIDILGEYGLGFDVSLTKYINGELEGLYIISNKTHAAHLKVHNNSGIKRDEDITVGPLTLNQDTDAVIEVSLKNKPGSSIYMYSSYKYSGSCRFDYDIPMSFC